MELNEFGKKLRRLRDAADLGQEQLAAEIEVSSFQLVSKWERGLKRPGRDSMLRLVEIFARRQLISPEEARRWALQINHELTFPELQELFPDYLPPPPQQRFQKPWQHPPLPNNYTNRPDLERRIHDFLLPAGPKQTLVLSGPGGVGKSTLAAWAAEELGQQFPDGVLWLEYPAENGVFEVQEQIAQSFSVDLSRATLSDRAKELRSLLRAKQCLLVLDDAWAEEDLVHLEVNNPHCPLIITTRDKAAAHIFKANPAIEVGGFSVTEGQVLLELLADADLPAERIDKFIERLEGLPLALSLVGVLLQLGFTFSELVNELEREPIDLKLLDIGEPYNRSTSLERCFDLSYGHLPSDKMRRGFAQLGCFAGPFSEEAAAKILGVTLSEARRTLLQFVRFNLVTRTEKSYRLHALLRDYARYRLTSDWADLTQTTFRRHAGYHLLHKLYHPQILDSATGKAPSLDQNWLEIVTGVKWAVVHSQDMAAAAVLLAHTERPALLEAMGLSLIEAVETYLSQISNPEEQAIVYEQLGELNLLASRNEAALSHFAEAGELWLTLENSLALSRTKLREAGIYLLLQDQQRAAEVAREAQTGLRQSLPLHEADHRSAHWLFYWFDVIYSVLVNWADLPEADIVHLADLAGETGQPKLEARGCHIYRLWCTANVRRQDETMRQKARQLAARAAWLWYNHNEQDKAEAEVMWTQEYTKGKRSRRLAKAFAHRRSRMTPEVGPEQIELIRNERLRQWLEISEAERVKWLLRNLPPPGSDDWESLEDILNVSIRGKNVRRLAQGIPCPEGHFLSEPMWRVFSGQKTLPLSGKAAVEIVQYYRAMLEAALV